MYLEVQVIYKSSKQPWMSYSVLLVRANKLLSIIISKYSELCEHYVYSVKFVANNRLCLCYVFQTMHYMKLSEQHTLTEN